MTIFGHCAPTAAAQGKGSEQSGRMRDDWLRGSGFGKMAVSECRVQGWQAESDGIRTAADIASSTQEMEFKESTWDF